MTSEYEYSVEDEVVIDVLGDLYSATVMEIDGSDPTYPYKVYFDDTDVEDWVKAEQIVCFQKDFDGASTDDEDYDWEVEVPEEPTTLLEQLELELESTIDRTHEMVAELVAARKYLEDLGTAVKALRA